MKKEKYIDEMEGRYRVRIRKNGVSYMKYFNFSEYPSKRICLNAAIADRDRALTDMRLGMYASKCEKTFDEVYREMKELFPRSVNTFLKFDGMYSNYFQDLSGILISKLTAVDIIRCLNAMVETCSDDTIARCLSIIRQVVRTARIKRYITVDVTEEVIAPKSKYLSKKRQALADIETVRNIIYDFENTKSYEKVRYERYMIAQAIKILLYTGIRPAECFALLRDNIDLENGTLHVTGQLGSTNTSHNVITPTKTVLSNRIIPLTHQAQDVLRNVLQMHENAFVFCKDNGEHFEMQKVQYIINVHCKKKGYKFTLYQLRHQFSTDMLMNGVDPRTVQELMGHAHFTMTADYARSNMNAKRNAIDSRKIDEDF